jgi:hypothetical protein
MTIDPYAHSDDLAALVGEAELVADRYTKGGVILIRTKYGWRAFLGNLPPETLAQAEKALDLNVPSREKMTTEVSRMPNLLRELQRLLSDCVCFEGYRPMKFTDELQETVLFRKYSK